MAKNIGFVSTRFHGTDGVSLESAKWAQVLWDFKHVSYWFAGKLDRAPEISMLESKSFFEHEKIKRINESAFGVKSRTPGLTEEIHKFRSIIKARLYKFIEKFHIDVIIAENCLTIPMNIPLGLALTELIAETGIPTIAHHHDFYWERSRFAINAVEDYLHEAFPPNLPNIQHVVINSEQSEQLALRTGISAIVIPNVLDFENPPYIDWEYTKNIRNEIGLSPEEKMILQPTRVIPRKGIEHTIDLMSKLGDPGYKLVITHEAGDEGFSYADWLKEEAEQHGVELIFIDHVVGKKHGVDRQGRRRYTLHDIYTHADFITFPSLYEGFGNAFLEAVYFKKPLLVNRYPTFIRDIEPKGFDFVIMDGYLTKDHVKAVREVMENASRREEIVEHNYRVATQHYSYSVLRKRLAFLFSNFFGIELY